MIVSESIDTMKTEDNTMELIHEFPELFDENAQYRWGNWTRVDNEYWRDNHVRPKIRCNNCGNNYAIPLEILELKKSLRCPSCGSC